LSIAEEYVDYLDSNGAIELFDKFKKSLDDNRELASKECDISKKSTYEWDGRKGDLKRSTKIKILDKAIEQFPVESFQFITQKLYNAGTETMMTCLSTIFEQTYDSKDSFEFKQHVNEFELMTKQYAGLIYKHRDLEVNHMFLKLKRFSDNHKYNWKPAQTILYDYESLKKIIPKIVGSYIFYSFPHSAEELAERENLPLDLVNDIHNELNDQLFSLPFSPDDSPSRRLYVGVKSDSLPPITAASTHSSRSNRDES